MAEQDELAGFAVDLMQRVELSQRQIPELLLG